MASGTQRGAGSWGQPAEGQRSSPGACYRELSRFPAVSCAALGATAGGRGQGQAFLLHTGESGPAARLRCARAGADIPVLQSAGSPTCPAGGSCASAATTAFSARSAASPSAGLRSARRSTTGTARGQPVRRGGAGRSVLYPPRLPTACRLLGQDSPSGQRRALLVRLPPQGHELLEVMRCRGRAGEPGAMGTVQPVNLLHPGVGWQRAQPLRGSDSAGEARGGLHRG